MVVQTTRTPRTWETAGWVPQPAAWVRAGQRSPARSRTARIPARRADAATASGVRRHHDDSTALDRVAHGRHPHGLLASYTGLTWGVPHAADLSFPPRDVPGDLRGTLPTTRTPTCRRTWVVRGCCATKRFWPADDPVAPQPGPTPTPDSARASPPARRGRARPRGAPLSRLKERRDGDAVAHPCATQLEHPPATLPQRAQPRRIGRGPADDVGLSASYRRKWATRAPRVADSS